MSDPVFMREVIADLRKVARGLSLIFSSYVVRITSVIFGGILIALFHDNPPLALSIFLFSAGAFLIGMLMSFVGRSFCLAVPEGSKAKSYIWASVTLDILRIAFLIGGAILEYPAGLSFLLAVMGEFVSVILFIVFLKHTSDLIRSERLVARANAVIVNGGFICGSAFVLFVILLYMPKRDIALTCFCATFAGMVLVVLFQYANLIRGLGQSIHAMVDAALQYIDPTENDRARGHSDFFE